MSRAEKLNKVQANENLEDAFNFDGRYSPDCDRRAYEILADGGTYAMIAAEVKVSLRTMQRWKQPLTGDGKMNSRYRESFAEACLLGRAANVAWFDKVGRDNLNSPNKHFNPVLYIYERKRRFNESEQRVIPLPKVAASTGYQDQAKALMEEATAGNLSPDELQKYTASLANIAKLIELETLINDVKDIKKRLEKEGNYGPQSDDEVDNQT